MTPYSFIFGSLQHFNTRDRSRDRYYYKMRQKLNTKASGFLLQIAKVLLQNAWILLQNVTFITNCNVYYKMRRYNRFLVPINHLKQRTS